jgi:hypothetical protein
VIEPVLNLVNLLLENLHSCRNLQVLNQLVVELPRRRAQESQGPLRSQTLWGRTPMEMRRTSSLLMAMTCR